MFGQTVQSSAIVISEDAFLANGGDLGDISGTIGTAMGPLRQASMAKQFLAAGMLGGCSGTWLGDSADGTTSYILTAAHCVNITEQGESVSKDFETHSLTIDTGTGTETWQTNQVAGGAGVAHVHPGRFDDESDTSTDVAIVALPKLEGLAAPDGAPVARPRVYIGRNELGKSVTFLGYGRWGVGNADDQNWRPDDGPRRSMGENILDGAPDGDNVSNFLDKTTGLDTGRWGRIAPGDSGSAWWQEQGGVWSIVASTSGGQNGLSIGPRTSSHWEWVRSLFPDLLMYDYRDAASMDANTVVFDNLLLQAAFAGSLGTGTVTVDEKGELWTVVDGALNGNALENNGLVIVKDDSAQAVDRLSGAGTLTLEGASHLGVDTPNAASDVYSGTFDGTGSFTKKGEGVLSLSGHSDGFTGQSLVEAGVLAVDGSVANSAVEVASGATIAGAGTVGRLSTAGTVAPGAWGETASYGTLNVGGDVIFLPGSIYQVNAEASGRSDRLVAGGNATLDGGTVAVSAANGDYQASTRYVILEAAGGLSGRFGDVATDLAFLTPALAYDGGSVILVLERNDVSFDDLGETRNQKETAVAVEDRGPGDPIHDAVAGGTTSEARHAYDLLSGDIYASIPSALLNESELLRSALLTRMRLSGMAGEMGGLSCLTEPEDLAERPGRGRFTPVDAILHSAHCAQLAVWGSAFNTWSGFEAGRLGAGALDASTGGFIAGADATFDDLWRIGIAAGFAGGTLTSESRSASASLGSYNLAAYGSRRLGNMRLGAGATYSWHDIDAQRAVNVRTFEDALAGAAHAHTGQIFGEAGYAFELGPMMVEPFAGLAYASVTAGGLTETGGSAALRTDEITSRAGFSTLGARVSSHTPLDPQTKLVLGGMLGWHHVLNGDAPSSLHAFADGEQSFEVNGVPIARNSLLAEAHIGLELHDEITLDFTYSGRIAAQSQDHSVKGTFSLRF